MKNGLNAFNKNNSDSDENPDGDEGPSKNKKFVKAIDMREVKRQNFIKQL